MRATFETDDHFRFVFFTEHGEELVRCFYPDGERETFTLEFFCKTLRAEAKKRKQNRKELRAYRDRNKKPTPEPEQAVAERAASPEVVHEN